MIDRFRADCARLVHPGGRLGLAVSGGPDSMAMLVLAHAAYPGLIEAATVDHGLRPESAEEAAMVARMCAERDIPHAVLPVKVSAGNVQAQARAARYAALRDWLADRKLDALLTAHHMDDQAETLLMRLNRGSGINGLAGIRARTQVPGGHQLLLRPLLGWQRNELAEVLAQSGMAAADDCSNRDLRFDRVRVRRALAASPWLNVAGLARSAALLAEAQDTLAFAVQREWSECITSAPARLHYAHQRSGLGATSLIRLGVLENAARFFECVLGPGEAARMAAVLDGGEPCNFGGMAARPATLRGEPVWQLTRENPRKPRQS